MSFVLIQNEGFQFVTRDYGELLKLQQQIIETASEVDIMVQEREIQKLLLLETTFQDLKQSLEPYLYLIKLTEDLFFERFEEVWQ